MNPEKTGAGFLAENVVHFVRVLRGAGLALGPAKVLDALAAVQATGIDHRDDFRSALAAVLVSRREQVELFEQALLDINGVGRQQSGGREVEQLFERRTALEKDPALVGANKLSKQRQCQRLLNRPPHIGFKPLSDHIVLGGNRLQLCPAIFPITVFAANAGATTTDPFWQWAKK